jgi:cystathionine gamma-synthase
LHLQTLAVHAGHSSDPATGAVTPPIYLATTFERRSDGDFASYVYTRSDNPNRRSLETKLAILEGGAEAFAFASGMAATFALFQSMLAPGDHVIVPDDCYHGARGLLGEVMGRWQTDYTEVDMSDPQRVADAVRPNTRLIWLETPSNPQLKIADIAAIAAIGKAKGIWTACDNTWATPYFQRPLALGVDAVMHSSTKYFGGHSDLLGGCVVLAEKSELSARIRDFQNYGGAVPAPFDCWLLLRSLATYPLRMPVHAHNAFEIAKFLEKHPKIERVFYPGLASHPNHAVAARQMTGGYGGMLSVQVRGGQAEALRFSGSMNIFRHATSLGGVESLIEHRLSAEGPHPKSPENLLRVSVGIEHIDDLLADLEAGLHG